MSEPLRAMMIGAHPDDVDICTCGITTVSYTHLTLPTNSRV